MYGRRRSLPGLVSLRSLGDTLCWAGWLHARFCHAFLVIVRQQMEEVQTAATTAKCLAGVSSCR